MNPPDIRKRLVVAFSRRFWLRHHMAVMLALVIGAGIVANHLLKDAAVWSLPLRYGLVVTISYLAFFPVGLLWLSYVKNELTGDPTWPRDVDNAVPEQRPAGSRKSGRGDIADGIGGIVDVAQIAADAPGCLASEAGCAVVLLIPLIIVLLGCGTWLIVQAPLILTDAAFETLLALALVGPVRRLEEEARSTGLLGATWHIYALVMVFAIVGGAFLQSMYPGVKTLGEAIALLF